MRARRRVLRARGANLSAQTRPTPNDDAIHLGAPLGREPTHHAVAVGQVAVHPDVAESALLEECHDRSDWRGSISTARAPPGSSRSGAPATSERRKSIPSSPPKSARSGSWASSGARAPASPGAIGGIRHQQAEALAGERCEPIPFQEGHPVGQAQALGVLRATARAADETSQATTRALGRSLARARATAPETRSHIGDPQLGIGVGRALERGRHQDLGLRPGHEDVGVHPQAQGPEFPRAP